LTGFTLTGRFLCLLFSCPGTIFAMIRSRMNFRSSCAPRPPLRYFRAHSPYVLNTRNEENNMVFYSYLACFVNTLTLNMYVSMQAEYDIHIRLVAPQEYVNIYSTRGSPILCLLFPCPGTTSAMIRSRMNFRSSSAPRRECANTSKQLSAGASKIKKNAFHLGTFPGSQKSSVRNKKM